MIDRIDKIPKSLLANYDIGENYFAVFINNNFEPEMTTYNLNCAVFSNIDAASINILKNKLINYFKSINKEIDEMWVTETASGDKGVFAIGKNK